MCEFLASNMYLYHMHTWFPEEVRRRPQMSWYWSDSHVSRHVDTGNGTWILCKSNKLEHSLYACLLFMIIFKPKGPAVFSSQDATSPYVLTHWEGTIVPSAPLLAPAPHLAAAWNPSHQEDFGLLAFFEQGSLPSASYLPTTHHVIREPETLEPYGSTE